MDATRAGASFVRQRLQWTMYGLIAGLLIGLVLGWIFRNVISAAFNFLLVAALLLPFLLAFMFWRKVQDERREDDRPVPPARDPSLKGGPSIETTYTLADRSDHVEPRER